MNLRSFVIISCFVRLKNFNICFSEKACNTLVPNNPSGLWIVLLTKLMTHPSTFIFADRGIY